MVTVHRKLKSTITAIIVVQAIVFFMLSFCLLAAREIQLTKTESSHVLREIQRILPELAENELYTMERYVVFDRSRSVHLARRINEGFIKNGNDLEATAEPLGITGAYVTDRDGNILFSYGEAPHTELPYMEEGPYRDIYGEYYGNELSDYPDYLIDGIPLNGDRFLTVETSTDPFFVFLETTFSMNEQLRILGMCCDESVFAVDASDNTIISHENADFFGETVRMTDLWNTGLKLFQLESSAFPIYIGSVYEAADAYIVAAVPLMDRLLGAIAYALQLTFVVTFAVSLVGRYVYYAVEKGASAKKEFSQNQVVLSVIGLVMVFSFSCFWQTLEKETDSYINLRTLLERNGEAQAIYEEESNKIEDWMYDQYLMQCYVAAEEVADHYDIITADDLYNLSETLGVEYVYVIDGKGETILTDSPYSHFVLKTEGDQSAAFRPLLEGVDHVVQEPMEDDVSGERRQYIGVSIRNEEGDVNGCVLISMNPEQIYDLQDMISVDQTLHYGLISKPDIALVIDDENLDVTAATDEDMIAMNAQDFGMTKEMLEAQQVDKIFYQDMDSIAGSYELDAQEMEGDFLVMGMYAVHPANAVIGALIISAYVLIVLLVFGGLGKKYYKELPPEETEQAKEEKAAEEDMINPEDVEEIFEDERGFFVFSKLAKTNEKYQFEERWNMKPKKVEEMNAGELTLHSLRGFAVMFCIVFLLPLLLYFLGWETPFSRVLGYVADGNWGNGINIFTIAQCILLICVMVLLDRILRRVLYYLARISPPRVETVCLLLRSSIKYIFAIIIIFYILLKMGIDPAALLASAGVLSVVIGFGARNVMADILAGFFIIFERSFDVGDFVAIGSTYGIVTEIGLRTTKVRWYADISVINNSEIKTVINQSGDVMRMIVPIRVRYEQKLEDLEALIEEALPEIGERITGLVQPPAYQGINRFAENGFDLRFALYTVGYQRMWAERQFLREMKLFLEKNHIETPYEQVIVHKEKTGKK